MSHDLLDIAIHSAQLGVANRQLQQMALLNAQVLRQQQAAQRQAILGQILFDTENWARRVQNASTTDIFAAGVLAGYWGQQVAGISPNDFITIEHKRQWAWAIGVLRSTWARVQSVQEVTDVIRAQQALDQLMARQPPEAQKAIAALESKIENRKTNCIVSGIGALVFGTLGLLLILLFALPKGEAPVGISIVLILGALICALVCFDSWRWHNRHSKELGRQKKAHQVLNGFLNDPRGGLLLQRARREHPLLGYSPEAPAYEQGARVIERQVVVTRCKYCQQMTPADGQRCQYCGAPGFS